MVCNQIFYICYSAQWQKLA